ncbi:hypothetical protein ABK040_005743 [Willaertia magna]
MDQSILKEERKKGMRGSDVIHQMAKQMVQKHKSAMVVNKNISGNELHIDDIRESRRNHSDKKDEDTLSSSSSYTFSVLSGATKTKVPQNKSAKLFNLQKVKEDAWKYTLERKKAFKKQLNFCEKFKEFLDSELADRVFCLCILYIASLLNYEKVKAKYELKVTDTNQQHLKEARKECVDRITELSFCYTQILQKYNFRNPHNLRFRDTLKENLFYEALYLVASYITTIDFPNQKLHGVIEKEIARLFRTKYFNAEDEKRLMSSFISAEDIYKLKHELGIKLPTDIRKRRNIVTAVTSRSPLISSVFPSFNRHTNCLEFGFEQIELEIPPNVLFSKNTETPSKSMQDQGQEDEESIRSSVMSTTGM